MRILTITSLYPNAVQPNLGVFVENRIQKIRELADVDIRVVAPVPWFPSTNRRFGRYADFARIEMSETRFGIPVDHPRVPVIPKIGMTLAPAMVYLALRRHLSRLKEQGYDFDLIDAHYFYPDGVAAAAVAKALGKPVVISARGSDINVIAPMRIPGTMIRWAGRSASACIAVSSALKDKMIEVGLDAQKIHVLRNGVDLEIFRPQDDAKTQNEFRPGSPTLLCVGNLVVIKAQDRVIRALAHIPEGHLVIVGQGDCEPALRRLAQELGVGDRVRFLGTVPHRELRQIYAAADVLVHTSRNEGWPNVLLESMACGTPVVATAVGGAGEIVTSPRAGRLLDYEASSLEIAEGVVEVANARLSRDDVRAHAADFGWGDVAKAQIEIYRRAIAQDTRSNRSL